MSVCQDNQIKNFRFGFKGGININGFTSEHTDMNTLFNAGIFSDYYFYKDYGISVEINYVQRGGILRNIVPRPSALNPYVSDFYAFNLYAKNNYLELPLFIKYKSIIGNDIIIMPNLGISYSIPLPFQESSIIKNKKALESSTLPEFTGQYSEDRAPLNSLIGINIGVSSFINNFVIELRYYYSFNEIGGAKNIEQLKYKIQSFQILVGYTF